MTPGFRLTAERARSLLVIELTGFFQTFDVARFAHEKQAAHADLKCATNSHVTLIDVTACKIQPQAVVAAFASLVAEPRYKARRLAFVAGSSLAKRQVRRIIESHPTARCFDDRPTAEAWLLE